MGKSSPISYLILYQWGKERKNITTTTILGSFLKATLEKGEFIRSKMENDNI
jgi:hypothetical protein